MAAKISQAHRERIRREAALAARRRQRVWFRELLTRRIQEVTKDSTEAGAFTAWHLAGLLGALGDD